ncbi:hypothetical protein [uncultured Ruminococcus sp.]|uniref:hypothetical protein n=1 Tax=uncultured Ruminococcus sp. TaxID=165186 RepID=UPI00292EC70B|nr:hypothetical protein [uncultured Ruminococcus sp.]
MDDLSEKLSGILNDPEAMRDIAALASQLGVESPGVHKEDVRPDPTPPDDTAAQMMKLMPMLGTLRQEDDTTRLLDAMRPFLSEERQQKLDRAKRLIKVMKLMPLIKDLPLGCSPLGRRHEVTVGDSPVRGNVRKADKRVAVLAERKASPPRNAPPAYIQVRTASALSSR